MKENIDIRDAIKAYGFTFEAVAKKMGVTRQYLSKLLRAPLTDKQRVRVVLAIRSLALDEAESKNQAYPVDFMV